MKPRLLFFSGLALAGSLLLGDLALTPPRDGRGVTRPEDAVRLATARFEAGTAAQVDLTTARTSQLRANHGYNVALAQLRRATGATEIEYTERSVPTKSVVP